jgi:hypothetical protein
MVLLHHIFFHVIQLFCGYINQECQLRWNERPQQDTSTLWLMLETRQQHRNSSKLLKVNKIFCFREKSIWIGVKLSSLNFIYKMFFIQYLKHDCLNFHHMCSYTILYQLIPRQSQLKIRLHVRSVHKIYSRKLKNHILRNSRSKIKSDDHKNFFFLNVVCNTSDSSIPFKVRLIWAQCLNQGQGYSNLKTMSPHKMPFLLLF